MAFFALRKQWPVWHRCIFQMLWLFLKMPGSTFAWEIFRIELYPIHQGHNLQKISISQLPPINLIWTPSLFASTISPTESVSLETSLKIRLFWGWGRVKFLTKFTCLSVCISVCVCVCVYRDSSRIECLVCFIAFTNAWAQQIIFSYYRWHHCTLVVYTYSQNYH